MALYLAIDAGGTKTRCWVADGTEVLGRAAGGTVKLMNVSAGMATAHLQGLMAEAAAAARVSLDQVTCTCMGLAGSSSRSVQNWARAAVSGVAAGRVVIAGDEEIALDAAFGDGPGVLVIAGTGSNILGRWGAIRASAGGWGPVLGDEGSGHWIGLEALRSALRALDRGEKSPLLTAVQQLWQTEDLGEVIARGNGRTRPDFAELAEIVVRCAREGDPVAAQTLERAGEALGVQVALAVEKLRQAGCPPAASSRVAFTGSVLQHIPAVRTRMARHLAERFPGMQVDEQAVEPLDGALWRARQAASAARNELPTEVGRH